METHLLDDVINALQHRLDMLETTLSNKAVVSDETFHIVLCDLAGIAHDLYEIEKGVDEDGIESDEEGENG